MTTSKVRLSRQAARDLEEIFDWIARESGAESAASVLQRLEITTEHLARFPRLWRTRRGLKSPSRIFPVSSWLIVYRERRRPKGVEIERVIHGRRRLKSVI